jgi:cyanate permease
MKGTNPNDGKEVDEYACAIAWLPMLLVENAMQARQTGACDRII